MPRKTSTAKKIAAPKRRSGSIFTSPADAAVMRDVRGTTLNQDPKSGLWIVRDANGKIVGKAKSQSAGRRLRYKTEAAQGLKVSPVVLKREHAKRDKAKTAAKKTRAASSTKTSNAKRAGTNRKRSGVKRTRSSRA